MQSDSALVWCGIGATNSRMMSKLSRLMPLVSSRPLSVSEQGQVEVALAGSVAGVAPVARIVVGATGAGRR